MIITPLDFVIILILMFFTINGFRHGFIDEMGRLISIIGGFIFSSKFHNLLIVYVSKFVNDETLKIAISYICTFVLSMIAITIIINFLKKFIELIILNWLNRLLGLLLGLLKGFLIVSLVIFIIQALPIKFDQENTIRQKLEKESIMYQICSHVKEIVILTVPINVKLGKIENKIKEISVEKNIQNILNQ